MATLTTVRISKGDSPNLGFRLQGGKDFGTPLIIQKVNGGSPAERAGLVAGDSVIKINNTDVFNLRHKDAQDVVVRAGPAFEITIQRGGSTWKPSVVPTGSFPTPSPVTNNISPVTRTSLAAQKGENIGAIGTGHNLSAKPFGPQVNGAVNGGPKLVSKQYNSPVKLYSEESIAETLSAQTEVLSTGVLGVNFKKNEKNYDASNSAVLRMLKETENEAKTPDEEPDSGVVTSPNSGIAGLRPVRAPENRPAPSTPQLPPGQNICADCERLIVGVFVRIKDKNLHVECFKCSTCGTSLKNVGYYNINNKLYCDVHAKSAAIRINANPNLVPITAPPGGKPPVQAISSALSSHSLPSPSPLSPKLNNSFASPYQPQESKESVVDVSSPLPYLSTNVTTEANNNTSLYNSSTPLSYSKYLNKSSSNFSGPKPFSSVSAPLSPASTLPRAAPLSPVTPSYNAPSYNAPSQNTPSYITPSYNASSYSPASSAGRSVQGIVWPPPQEEPDVPTACPLFYPPPSQIERTIFSKRAAKEANFENSLSECQEVEEINAMARFLPKISTYSEEVQLCERKSAVECIETISETLETQKLVENILKTKPISSPPAYADIKLSELPKPPSFSVPSPESDAVSSNSYQRKDSCELKRPTQFTPNTIECHLPSVIDNAVPQKWESPLIQAIRTTAPDSDTFAQIPSKHSSTPLASALAIAPARPFSPIIDTGKPVPLPEETVPYFPPERPIIPEPEPKEPKPKPQKPKSQFVKALETAPERPFTPVGGVPPLKKKPKDPTDKYFEDLPKPQEKLTMLTALTTAPDRPYSPLIVESVVVEGVTSSVESQSTTKNIDRSQLYKPLKPDVLPASFQINQKEPKPPCYYPPSVLYQRTEECNTEEHTEETDTSKTRTIERQTIHNPQVTEVVVEKEPEEHQNFAPMFQAVSCFYHNKKDNFTIEISTTPPIPTPPPKPPTPIARIIENKPGYIEKETFTEEQHARQQTTKKQQQTKEEVRGDIKAVKQAEEVILKKAKPPVILHKPEGLPSYQVQLSENVEADLLLMEKKQKAQSRLEQQKFSQRQEISAYEEQQFKQQQFSEQQNYQQQQIVQQKEHLAAQKPIITLQPDESKSRNLTASFKPVVEDRPPSTTFSPRPRSLTPSMINKPPPVLPYYQSNLVAHQMGPPEIYLLDPTSPAISRSPSPCPGGRRDRSRSPSPFPSKGVERAVSPAPGPPPNPLKSSQRLPTPKDTKIEHARENLNIYIPEYKNKIELIEKARGTEFYKRSEETQQCQVQQNHTQQSQVQQNHTLQSQGQQNHTQQSQVQQNHTEQNQSQQCQLQQNRAQQSQIQQCKIQEKQSNQPTQMYVSQVRAQSFPIQQQSCRQYESVVAEKHNQQFEAYQSKKLEVQEAQCAEKYCSKTAEGTTFTQVAAQSNQAHLEEFKKSQNQSVKKSADGLVQIQRKTTVTEEYEQTHKETNIEKRITSTNPHPFRNANTSAVEGPGKPPLHFTNPQPLSKNFCQLSEQSNHTSVQQQCQNSCAKSCQKEQTCQKFSQSPTSCQSQAIPAPIKHVFAPSSLAPVKHVDPPGSAKKPNQNVIRPNVSQPNAGAGGGRQAGGISVVPKRGRGVLNTAAIGGARIPLCGHCNMQIRGPFITALGKIWCPSHFICATPSCRRPLQDLGFVEERGQLYCEYCFEQYLAPPCSKCSAKIKGDCLKAIGKNFHPECFNCIYCGKLFGNNPFFLDEGNPYCEADWNELFTTKCFACGFPVEAGDRWVEALNNNYHSQCFNCTMCKKNLEGQSFFAKGGRPFCKNHAR